MTEIVLHIGTPKTGTTSIQHALSTNEDLLADKNITFIKTGRHRASHNDLANAISRHGVKFFLLLHQPNSGKLYRC